MARKNWERKASKQFSNLLFTNPPHHSAVETGSRAWRKGTKNLTIAIGINTSTKSSRANEKIQNDTMNETPLVRHHHENKVHDLHRCQPRLLLQTLPGADDTTLEVQVSHVDLQHLDGLSRQVYQKRQVYRDHPAPHTQNRQNFVPFIGNHCGWNRWWWQFLDRKLQ